MSHTTPARRYKGYHTALIVLVVVVLACVGFSALQSISPLTQLAMRELGTESITISEVQQKVADKFGLNIADVSVEVKTTTFGNNLNHTLQTRALFITLVNTVFNNVPSAQRKEALVKVASFAHDNYDARLPVDRYCVVLVTKWSFLISTHATYRLECFSADEL